MPLTIASGGLYVKFGRKFVPTTATVEEFDAMQSELRRLRIAQLRRMVSSIPGAIERTQWFPAYTEQEFERKKWRRRDRFTRFAKACNAEIARLRGEG